MTNQNILSFFLLFFLLSFNFSQAQTDIEIGEWKSHLSYQAGKYVTQSDQDIIYATNWGIVYIDKEDHSVRTLDKLKGLSNVGIERIKYNQTNDVLIIAYSNSVIDLVKEREIITLLDIQRFNNIAGDKRIYDIFLDSDSTALLATGYGVSRINLNENIFTFSTFTGVPTKGIIAKDNMIYTTTDEGIYRVAHQSNVNIQDFGTWEFLGDNGFPSDYTARSIVIFNHKIYVVIDNELYRYDSGLAEKIYTPEDDFTIEYLTAEGEYLVVGESCLTEVTDPTTGELKEIECGGTLFFFDTNENYTEIGPCVNRPLHAIEDENGIVWIADRWYRFRSYDIKNESCNGGFSLNSPFSEKNYDLAIKDGKLWVTAGGLTLQNHFQFWFEGIYSLINGQWNFYNTLNRPKLGGNLDFLKIAIHPEKDIIYFSTFYNGLVKYENDTFAIFNDANSTLGNSPVADTNRTKTMGIAFDKDNNLWIANPTSPKPISVFLDNGEMKNFAIPAPASNIKSLFDLEIDDNGFKWFAVTEASAGILVFDEGDMEVNGDERVRAISSGNSALSTNQVNCIEKDLDGDMWVGTSDGIIIFECGSNIFDEAQCKGTRKIVEQDGIPAYLLVAEDVKAIAVDGANRKWVGTTTGIFVLSSDGEELIARYNTENSPLFDNTILDIEIDKQSGEVFIATGEGLISYRGTATHGGNTHQSNVLVFPNPVRPDHVGPIAIRGLARDSNVKITDITGQLVFETKALGGQAIWDGRDYSGRKAATGVYLVLGTTTKNLEEPQSVVAKILFVN
ncbi:MAG TPA: hypothetical protein ENJ53_01290 [Phaeodactylibacter sp.]|nr:hypothetical protein [Phaeodactylibacter sp.]